MLLDRVYPSPPNCRTGYENLRETPIIYIYIWGYTQLAARTPCLPILEQGMKIRQKVLANL